MVRLMPMELTKAENEKDEVSVLLVTLVILSPLGEVEFKKLEYSH